MSVLVALLSAAAATPAGAANGAPPPAATGEIAGQIVLYPASPVARSGEPLGRGVPGRVAVEAATGAVIARIASDPKGRFEVALPPGRYTLRLLSQRPPATSRPAPVTVRSGQVSRAVITLDAGIR